MVILRWKVNSEETQIQHPLLSLFTSTLLSSRRKHIQACKWERGTWSQNVNSIWVCIVFTIHIHPVLSCPRIDLKQQRRALCRKSSPPHCTQSAPVFLHKCDESNTNWSASTTYRTYRWSINHMQNHQEEPSSVTPIGHCASPRSSGRAKMSPVEQGISVALSGLEL